MQSDGRDRPPHVAGAFAYVFCTVLIVIFFFFSSRRRHTRFDCDWSSDVCSSDLAAADVIVTFWGTPRRLAANTWIHQCGSVEEAKAAAAAGADMVVAQGVEAGGHVRGSTPMLELLELVHAAVKIPVLAAGGIIDPEGVKTALDAGAVAAVAGTRFLLSD